MNVDANKLVDRLTRNHAATVAKLELEKAALECQVEELLAGQGGKIVHHFTPGTDPGPEG